MGVSGKGREKVMLVSFVLSVSLCQESFNFLLVSCDLEPKNQFNANKAVLAVAGTWLTASSNSCVSLCACVCELGRSGVLLCNLPVQECSTAGVITE